MNDETENNVIPYLPAEAQRTSDSNNSYFAIRLPTSLRDAFFEAAGGRGEASEKLRGLMARYVKERGRKR